MDSSFSNDSRSTKKSQNSQISRDQNSQRSRDQNSRSHRDTESLPSENYDRKGRSRRRREDEISSDFRSTSRSESGTAFLSTDDGKTLCKVLLNRIIYWLDLKRLFLNYK